MMWKLEKNTAKTLEYAYADFTVAQMAKRMGKDRLAKKYYEQSFRYKNVFDPSNQFNAR